MEVSQRLKIDLQSLEGFLQFLDEACLLFESDQTLAGWNHAAKKVFGLTDDETAWQFLGRVFLDPAFKAFLKSAKASTPSRKKVKLTDLDGNEREFRIVAFPLTSTSSRSLGTMVILRESLAQEASSPSQRDLQSALEELEEKNARLIELDKVKNEFLGMAAHDLRNPLHRMTLAAEVLMDKNIPESKKDQFIPMLSRTAQAMLALINDLLNITKIESGRIVLKPENVPLDGYFKELVQFQQVIAQRKNIELQYQPEHISDEAVFDRERVHQVVSNLLSNAIKFSQPDTQVELHVRCDDKVLTVACIDRGPGIKEDDREHLFRPFEQLPNKPTAGEESTGLGLAICKRIVELHGGTIRHENREGGGSVFVFEIPQERE